MPALSLGARELDDSELLQLAFELLRDLAGSNIRSLELAKQLMVAQELADLHGIEARAAIDRAAAAAAAGDPSEVERAIASVSTADRTADEEFALSREWSLHRGEVHQLVETAEHLLGLSRTTRNGTSRAFVPS